MKYELLRKDDALTIIGELRSFPQLLNRGDRRRERDVITLEKKDLLEALTKKANKFLIRRAVLLSFIILPPLKSLENALTSILF